MRPVALSRLSNSSCTSLGSASAPNMEVPPNEVTDISDCKVLVLTCLGLPGLLMAVLSLVGEAGGLEAAP